MSKIISPVSVVISTRAIDEVHMNKVKKSFSHPKTEMLIYVNNGDYSLPQLYNKGLSESKHDIIVFMHDDVIFETTNITGKLNKLFKNHPEHGIIGLAGTDTLITGKWWERPDKTFGQVKHEHNGRVHRNNFSGTFGDNLKDVVAVDGLFIAVHKQRIKEKFDEEFTGFHFYDIPFCVANYTKGVKIGVTTKILVIHKSVGMLNKKWEKNKLFFEAKYGEHLPLII